VTLHIKSADVLHNFWVPELDRKVQALPGHDNIIPIMATQSGTYHGFCAAFCGLVHAMMRFAVVVQPADQLNAETVLRQKGRVRTRAGLEGRRKGKAEKVEAPADNKVDSTNLRSVTLLVTPAQAAKLSLGQNKGTLHLTSVANVGYGNAGAPILDGLVGSQKVFDWLSASPPGVLLLLRAAPGVTLVDVSMIGAAGRIYLAGPVADVRLAQAEITEVLSAVAGREQ